MASCLGKRNCVHLTVARDWPYGRDPTRIQQHGRTTPIYRIDPASGNMTPMGHDINLQINAFGLNTKDGFLYGMHEVSEVFGPRLARVDSNGDYVDIDTIPPPAANGTRRGIINTAAATMDGNDNYYFTAIVVDTANLMELLEIISWHHQRDIQAKRGRSHYKWTYKRVLLGSCLDEILQSLSNPANGLPTGYCLQPPRRKNLHVHPEKRISFTGQARKLQTQRPFPRIGLYRSQSSKCSYARPFRNACSSRQWQSYLFWQPMENIIRPTPIME